MGYETSQNLALPPVFEYLDYRSFLRDFYLGKKQRQAQYSYRIFSLKTGVKSPNYMKLIIDGQRNLTRPHARRVAKYCGLNKSETDYFLALAQWNQCQQPEDRDLHWEKLLLARPKGESHTLDAVNILTHWHVIAIMEMLRLDDVDGDPGRIAIRFRGELTTEQLKDALASLERAGLIRREGARFVVTNRILKTPDDIPSACVRDYHHRVILEGLKALEETPVNLREFNAATLAIGRSQVPELKKAIREFRDRILELAGNTASAEEVYQLNMQLFPLTENIGGES